MGSVVVSAREATHSLLIQSTELVADEFEVRDHVAVALNEELLDGLKTDKSFLSLALVLFEVHEDLFPEVSDAHLVLLLHIEGRRQVHAEVLLQNSHELLEVDAVSVQESIIMHEALLDLLCEELQVRAVLGQSEINKVLTAHHIVLQSNNEVGLGQDQRVADSANLGTGILA